VGHPKPRYISYNDIVGWAGHPPGPLDYHNAPWFDWGPYLWASGENPRTDGLNWCNGQGDFLCSRDQRDFRDGDISSPSRHAQYWGDYTHPSAKGAKKVADSIKDFLTNQNKPSYQWLMHWIQQ
jgi:hypothetical protein